jgi:uncharacterized protein (TIGR03083 family)
MSKPQLTKEFWLTALRAEGDAFRAAVSNTPGLDAEVPSCPEWTVRDLVNHLTSVYNRALGIVTSGALDSPGERVELDGGDDVLGCWTDKYVELLAALDAVDPEAGAWNWAPQSKRAVFWHRRMAHETAVHRWDAQMANGLAEPIEAKLAGDGVTEVLDTWLPAGRRRGAPDHAGVIALHATDLDEVWYVRLRGTGIALLDTDTLLDSDEHHERATASGSASDLVLALFGRIPFDALEVGGDLPLLEGLRVG